nr:MAG TPA_asm: Serine hydroxymethyltransferase [Caudoviricetes sp.]
MVFGEKVGGHTTYGVLKHHKHHMAYFYMYLTI